MKAKKENKVKPANGLKLGLAGLKDMPVGADLFI